MSRTTVSAAVLAGGAALVLAANGTALAAGAAPQGINAGHDFPYPTGYQSQPVANLGGGIRPPVPTGFTTRRLGTRVSTANIGVQQVIVARDPKRMTWTVRFQDGIEAPFIDGRDTIVGTTRYQGIGFRGGVYVVQNLQTREYLKFSWQPPR